MDEYTVERICEHKFDNTAKEWLVKVMWADYPGEDSWEPLDSMIDQIEDLVKDYCQDKNLTWYRVNNPTGNAVFGLRALPQPVNKIDLLKPKQK